MSKLKKIVLVSTILLFTFILSACSSKEEVYKLGFIGTLTGPYSEVGVHEMYGAQMAVEEINRSGGINGVRIELIIRDDEANSNKAIEMQNELQELGCNVIIGHSLSIVAEDAVENANNSGILLLSPSIGTDELSGVKDNLIRNVATVYAEAQFISQNMENQDANNILFIYNLDNFFLTKYHLAGVEDYFNNNFNGTVITVGYHSSEDDEVSEVETLLKNGGFDNVFISAPNTDAALFINCINANNLDSLKIHLSSWASAGIIPNLDVSKTNNIFAYSDYNVELNDVRFETYTNKYFETYGIEANMLSSNAYDLVYIMKDILGTLDDWEIDSIMEKFRNGYQVEGINSDYFIDEYGDCINEMYIYGIIEGEYKIITD